MLLLGFIMAIILFYVTREQDPHFCGQEIINGCISHASCISEVGNARGGKQVRAHPGGQPGWRGDGMERASRMGHRKRQRKK